jgi:hypothetical protein
VDASKLDACVAELTTEHGCHTVLLYGSHARGDATPASDYDLLGLREVPGQLRIAHTRLGVYLDAFVHGPELLDGPFEPLLKLRGARVLVQREGLGDRLLALVEARFQEGPTPWPPDERAAVRAWVDKTLDRIARGDVEGHYRRVMLLHNLLEDYFHARGQWYLGSKAALAWLAAHDPATCQAFEVALAPGADLADVTSLARRVWAGVEDGPARDEGHPRTRERSR